MLSTANSQAIRSHPRAPVSKPKCPRFVCLLRPVFRRVWRRFFADPQKRVDFVTQKLVPGKQPLLLISINFTPKTSNPAALKKGTLGFPGRVFFGHKTENDRFC